MLRYLGPKVKKLRQLNIHMQPGFSTKYSISKNYTLKNNKVIMSFYFLELLEKQKLKYMFSLSEKIIKKYILFIQKYNYKKFNLSNIIETRFDNILFKLGYSNTISQARQWIVHGHFFINFMLVKKPSYLVKKGDIISISPNSVSIIKLCKKNLYNKYSIISTSQKYLYICKKTLISIIYMIIDMNYTFINYNDFLISQYYSN